MKKFNKKIGSFLLTLLILAIVNAFIRNGTHSFITTEFGRNFIIDHFVKRDFTKELADLNLKMNKDLPKMIDRDTRIESVKIGSDRNINYLYTLVNYSYAGIDKDKFNNAMRPTVIKNGCSLLEPRNLSEQVLAVNYIYQSNDLVEVSRIAITPKDCGISSK